LLRTSREVVNEATAPAKIRDSWEDVSTVAAPPLGKDILQKQPINGILSMTPRTYTKSELFELRLQRSTSPPPDLPSFLVGVSTAGDFRGVRRLGPGGTTRGGGAGAGGGGSGGTGPRYTGSMEDPRRDQTFRRGIESTRGGAIARLSILQQHTNGIAVTELSKRIALKTTGALKRLSRLKQHSIAGIASTNTQMNWRGH